MTTVSGRLFEMLKSVAVALGDDLRDRLVFVGGCTTALFITDKITLEDVRTTDDVDLIVSLAGFPAWAQLLEQLREKGFSEAPDDEVICRMRLGELKVDFMPDDETILGFGNRWYATGIETAVPYRLEDGIDIRVLRPEFFVATKLEAYLGRGNNDLFSSRDAEDILLIVDGREELLDEIRSSEPHVREYISKQVSELLKHTDFDGFISGNIRGPEGRADIVWERFGAISRLAD